MTVQQTPSFGGSRGKASVQLKNQNVTASLIGSNRQATEEEVISIGQAVGNIAGQWAATTVPGMSPLSGGAASASLVSGADFKFPSFGGASKEKTKEQEEPKAEEKEPKNDPKKNDRDTSCPNCTQS